MGFTPLFETKRNKKKKKREAEGKERLREQPTCVTNYRHHHFAEHKPQPVVKGFFDDATSE